MVSRAPTRSSLHPTGREPMDLSALLAQSEIVVLVFLLLCFVGLLLIFYITYRTLSNLREELQDQIDVASARLERLERGLAPSTVAALNDTQGAQSLNELLDDETPAPQHGRGGEPGRRPAYEAASPNDRPEESTGTGSSHRRSQIDSEELAMLEAEALSGQLREGVFAAGGSTAARTAWHTDAEAGIPGAQSTTIPEEDTDWEGIDLSETSIVFDEADLEDETTPYAESAVGQDSEGEDNELLLDLSEESGEVGGAPVESGEAETDLEDSDAEPLDFEEIEGDEITAANEWRAPMDEDDELVIDGVIQFEDISEDDLSDEGQQQLASTGSSDVSEPPLTFDESDSTPMEDELSLGDDLIIDELEEPSVPSAGAQDFDEVEGEIAFAEELHFEDVEPALDATAQQGEPSEIAEAAEIADEAAAPFEEAEGTIDFDEALDLEEIEEPAADEAAPAVSPAGAQDFDEPEGEIAFTEELDFEDVEPALDATAQQGEPSEIAEAAEPAETAERAQPIETAEVVEPVERTDEATPLEEEDEVEISLEEDLIVEQPEAVESDEEERDALIFADEEPTIVAAPTPVSEDVDEELVFEELSEGLGSKSVDQEQQESSLAGASLLPEDEGMTESPAAGLQKPEAPDAPAPSKRVVSIEDDDYEFDNPSETMILLDEDMEPARRAFVEEDEELEGDIIGGNELFETLEREDKSADDYGVATPESLSWVRDEDAPIYFSDADEPEQSDGVDAGLQARDSQAEPDTSEKKGELAGSDELAGAQSSAAREDAVLDEKVPEPSPEDLDLDVELALNETFLEDDLLYLEGLMKDSAEAETAPQDVAAERPKDAVVQPGPSASQSFATTTPPASDDDDIVFDDIGKVGANAVDEKAESSSVEPSATEEESLDFMLEEDNIEFEMPPSPDPSATSYMSDDDDIFFDDEPEMESRPRTTYEAIIESADSNTKDEAGYDDMVIDFENDIAALEDLLDQSKNKPNGEQVRSRVVRPGYRNRTEKGRLPQRRRPFLFDV
eukprot:TRINITY_DN1520_c0_g1_i2.p1 TRINITY_DN1520_c0_g1~~TRINITY_DN1520_c0_g1_i2.p1  ORF type:complete len:1018 (+),score=245.31 TRINITY_DN1520_c0_g1_i2:33006-36059(+)